MRATIKDISLLAAPIVVSQIGHIVTGMVDNIFLGTIGKTEQAAGILANNVFVLILVFGIGLSYAITPLVSAAYVKQDLKEKAALLKNGLLLNALVSVILFLLLFFMTPLLRYMGQPEDVIDLAIPFFNVLMFSIIPVSFFFVGKQYTEGLGNTRAAMYISIAGNLLNIVLNYVLIHGLFGLPELGYMGSCWATFFARLFMGVAFIWMIFGWKGFNEINSWYKQTSFDFKHSWELFKIGIGSAMQFTFEVAAFVIAGIMTGWFGKESIDAHGISMSIAAFTYMFGSGISGAASIRVSASAANGDRAGVIRYGMASFYLVWMVTGFCAVLMVLLNHVLPLGFSNDNEIVQLSATLLLFAAFFQLFDGTQVVALGILRGLEDVKIPTLVTLVGYWLIALPLCYFLGKVFDMQVIGIWIALSVSLVFVASMLYWRFRYLANGKLIQSSEVN